jgi:hypothetical protein
MKKTWMLVVVAVSGLLVLATSLSMAEEKKVDVAPAVQAETTVTGLVAVTKDGDKVKQITIGQGDAMICVCTSTEAGKKIADLAGKTVKATGTVAEKGGKKVITVTKAEEVKVVAQ